MSSDVSDVKTLGPWRLLCYGSKVIGLTSGNTNTDDVILKLEGTFNTPTQCREYYIQLQTLLNQK